MVRAGALALRCMVLLVRSIRPANRQAACVLVLDRAARVHRPFDSIACRPDVVYRRVRRLRIMYVDRIDVPVDRLTFCLPGNRRAPGDDHEMAASTRTWPSLVMQVCSPSFLKLDLNSPCLAFNISLL